METPFRANSVTCPASPRFPRTEWPLVTRLLTLVSLPHIGVRRQKPNDGAITVFDVAEFGSRTGREASLLVIAAGRKSP
jgi:hypothetical protein